MNDKHISVAELRGAEYELSYTQNVNAEGSVMTHPAAVDCSISLR